MGRKSIEELEELANSGDKEAMEKLWQHRIGNHSEMRRMKIYMRRMVTIMVAIAVVVVGVAAWFFFSGTAKKVTDMQIDAARYSLFRNPVEYQIIERDATIAMENLRDLSYKYTKEASTKLDEKQLGQYVSLVCFYKAKYDRDPYLVMAITAAESEFDPTKISRSGAMGVQQMMPITFREMNRKLCKYRDCNILDVYDNTDASLFFMYDVEKSLCREFGLASLTIRQLACAYNGGINRAYKSMKASRYDAFMLPGETIEYMDKVVFYYTNYKKGNFRVWYYEQAYTTKPTNAIDKSVK